MGVPSCCVETQLVFVTSCWEGHMLLSCYNVFFSHYIFCSIPQDKACYLIVPSLKTGCNKARRVCFPDNTWVEPTLKASKWSLGAGPYLASSSLTFAFHRGFPNALWCLSKCSLTENIRDCCWVGIILLQYGSAAERQVVTCCSHSAKYLHHRTHLLQDGEVDYLRLC